MPGHSPEAYRSRAEMARFLDNLVLVAFQATTFGDRLALQIDWESPVAGSSV